MNTLEKEEWRPIDKYPGFEVSNTGKIRSIDRTIIQKSNGGNSYKRLVKGHIIPLQVDHGGYKVCCICINNKNINLKIHRIVAQVFIQNPDNLPEVNHIDGDKTNNSVDNLEWCTPSHNQLHAVHTGLRKSMRPVRCVETGTVYLGIGEAARQLNLTPSSICGVLKDRCKHTHNLHFEYIK